MTSLKMQRIYSLHSGPFQATLYPSSSGRQGYIVDLYHSGNDQLHSRFVCTGEEADALFKLAIAAQSLIENYLGRGKTFEQWCRDRGIDPFSPDLPN